MELAILLEEVFFELSPEAIQILLAVPSALAAPLVEAQATAREQESQPPFPEKATASVLKAAAPQKATPALPAPPSSAPTGDEGKGTTPSEAAAVSQQAPDEAPMSACEVRRIGPSAVLEAADRGIAIGTDEPPKPPNGHEPPGGAPPCWWFDSLACALAACAEGQAGEEAAPRRFTVKADFAMRRFGFSLFSLEQEEVLRVQVGGDGEPGCMQTRSAPAVAQALGASLAGRYDTAASGLSLVMGLEKVECRDPSSNTVLIVTEQYYDESEEQGAEDTQSHPQAGSQPHAETVDEPEGEDQARLQHWQGWRAMSRVSHMSTAVRRLSLARMLGSLNESGLSRDSREEGDRSAGPDKGVERGEFVDAVEDEADMGTPRAHPPTNAKEDTAQPGGGAGMDSEPQFEDAAEQLDQYLVVKVDTAPVIALDVCMAPVQIHWHASCIRKVYQSVEAFQSAIKPDLDAATENLVASGAYLSQQPAAEDATKLEEAKPRPPSPAEQNDAASRAARQTISAGLQWDAELPATHTEHVHAPKPAPAGLKFAFRMEGTSINFWKGPKVFCRMGLRDVRVAGQTLAPPEGEKAETAEAGQGGQGGSSQGSDMVFDLSIGGCVMELHDRCILAPRRVEEGALLLEAKVKSYGSGDGAGGQSPYSMCIKGNMYQERRTSLVFSSYDVHAFLSSADLHHVLW